MEEQLPLAAQDPPWQYSSVVQSESLWHVTELGGVGDGPPLLEDLQTSNPAALMKVASQLSLQ